MATQPPSTKLSSQCEITLLGLGPGDPGLLTQEAVNWLQGLDTLYLRTKTHLAVRSLPGTLKLTSFDDHLMQSSDYEVAEAALAAEIIRLAKEQGSITYAVPGNPLVAERTCQAIIQEARNDGISIRVIHGLSLLEPTVQLLALDTINNLVLLDALQLEKGKTPGFSPSSTAIIFHLSSQAIAAGVKRTLLSVYPQNFEVQLVHITGTNANSVEKLPLAEMDESLNFGIGSSLFVPPLHSKASFESFQEIIARLRAPDGCPWDREQTHLSLRPFLLEETYETLDALDRADKMDLQEELGDLLLQILLHAQIASENADFNIHDVILGIGTKLVRRHPHVFADIDVADVSGVIRNWETIKAEERLENGLSHKKGLLDGVPQALPALSQSQAIIERVGRARFQALIDKGEPGVIRQILTQMDASDISDRKECIGDLLLAVSALAYRHGIDAESALREELARFRARFSQMERITLEEGVVLADLSDEEKMTIWQRVGQNMDHGMGMS